MTLPDYINNCKINDLRKLSFYCSINDFNRCTAYIESLIASTIKKLIRKRRSTPENLKPGTLDIYTL